MDFASCCGALEESGSVQTWITGLTKKQLPLKSQNVPHIRYANITDEYKNKHKKKTKNQQTKGKKNDQQNILVATVSLDKTVSLKRDEKINQVILV